MLQLERWWFGDIASLVNTMGLSAAVWWLRVCGGLAVAVRRRGELPAERRLPGELVADGRKSSAPENSLGIWNRESTGRWRGRGR